MFDDVWLGLIVFLLFWNSLDSTIIPSPVVNCPRRSMTRAASKWRQRLGMHVLFPSSTLENPNTYYIGWHFVHLFTAEKPRLSLKVPFFFAAPEMLLTNWSLSLCPGRPEVYKRAMSLPVSSLESLGNPWRHPWLGKHWGPADKAICRDSRL